jgi:hypothetical protein
MSTASVVVSESSANRRKEEYDDLLCWCTAVFATRNAFDCSVARIRARVLEGFDAGDQRMVDKYIRMMARRRDSGDTSAYSRDEKALAAERCRIMRRANYAVAKLRKDIWGDYAVKPIMLRYRPSPK